MAEQPAAENKMGVMPVNGLLLNMSIPILISMLVQALYNVVDSYFVSKIHQDALNAVSLAFPVQNLTIAVAIGTAVGVNALLARSLGQGDREKVNRSAVNGLFLAAMSFLVFMVLGLTCSRLFYSVQTDIPGIVEYGTQYLTIVCGASFGMFGAVTMERLLQATGRTFYSMISQAAGAVTNIILDYLLIFGIGPFPELKVAGAAVATVIGQIVGFGISTFFNITRNPDIRLSLKGFRPHGRTIREIYSVGLPGIVMQSIGSVMVFGMNQILIAFTDTATAVFGVYFKLQSFFFMPVFGLNSGMVPIVSYNYGARKPKRITKTIKLSACYATALMVLGCIVFQVFPARLLAMFQSENEAGKEAGLISFTGDGDALMTFYDDGTYVFSAGGGEDAGTYAYADGVLTLTDSGGAVTAAEGSPLALHYACSGGDGPAGDFTISASRLDAFGRDLISIGVPALRIISLSWLLAGFGIVCSSVFQALNHGVFSLIGSLVRQLAVLLPAAFLLSLFFPLDVVWLAFPIAELFSCALCSFFLYRVYRRDVLPLAHADQ